MSFDLLLREKRDETFFQCLVFKRHRNENCPNHIRFSSICFRLFTHSITDRFNPLLNQSMSFQVFPYKLKILEMCLSILVAKTLVNKLFVKPTEYIELIPPTTTCLIIFYTNDFSLAADFLVSPGCVGSYLAP